MTKKRLDELGNRMKTYERQETELRFMPNTYLYVRIDGRSFSKFTKGLKRPYDKRMSDLMIETLKYLVKETNAIIGSTQSDELSLLIYNGYQENTSIFDGKKQKLVSIISGLASGYFNSKLSQYLPEKTNYERIPTFDCRVFSVPNVNEAVNAIWWRELDCVKNSISMAAHDNFSHKELHKKNSKDMKDMLLNCKGISWDEYPEFFKYGTYVKRILYMKPGENGEMVQHSKVDIIEGNLSQFNEFSDKLKFILE